APEEILTAAEQPAIALDLDDLYLAGEPVTLRAQLVNVHESQGPLQARIEPVDPSSTAPVLKLEFTETQDGWTLETEVLAPGLYRTEVRTAKAGPLAPPPVHDLLEVAGMA